MGSFEVLRLGENLTVRHRAHLGFLGRRDELELRAASDGRGLTTAENRQNERREVEQQGPANDPHAGDLYVFRGARGDLLKIVWHDGIGMSLYAKRLERGRFIWPSPADGAVAITAAQLAYMLDGIDWRNPVFTWRPEVAG